MAFVQAAVVSDLADGKCKKVKAGKQEIFLARIGGSFYAMSNICPHLGGTLSEGTMADGIITCPLHGSKYDVKTGKNVGGAIIGSKIVAVADNRGYAVKVDGNDVLVDVG